MAEFPSLPLFTDSWFADTAHLTRLERGTYMDLLVLMWRSPECRVPNDDAWLARKLRMTVEEVKIELRPVIEEFCQTTGNWLSQKRLTKEWEWCRKKRATNRESAKSRWEKEKPISEGNARDAMPPTLPDIVQKQDPPPTPPGGKRPRPKAVLPDNWMLSTADAAFAAERGYQGQRVRTMVERFVNHHRSQRSLSADWAASWRTWVLKQVEFDARDRHGGAAGGMPMPNGGTRPRAGGGPSFFDIAQGNFGQEATDGE